MTIRVQPLVRVHHLRNRCPTVEPLPKTVVGQVNSGDNHSNAQPLAIVPRGPHAGVPSEDRRIVCQPQPPVGERTVRGTQDTRQGESRCAATQRAPGRPFRLWNGVQVR